VDLTTQLLAFSRRQAVAPTVLAIADVLTGVGRFLRPLIGEDILLEVSVGPGTGSIRADRTKIEQVILNLATNARDAMPVGGCLTITVNAAALAVSTTVDGTPLAAGPYVMIRVEDTGAGMDEETQARAFEPFFSTKGPGRGTGIGLATVHGIVTQCGGAVALTSRIGVGTTVTIYLPQVAAEAVEPRIQQESSAPIGGTETVLLVEDEHEVRELVRDMLEMAGYSVLEAKLPRAAEAMCREHSGPVHLLLTDVVMPELSGREVAKRIRAASPSTKVLFMSGYPDYPGSSSEVSGFEGVEYLAKPFDRRLLLTRVRGMLDGATV
jgi:CheY-like chemotaxis protein